MLARFGDQVAGAVAEIAQRDFVLAQGADREAGRGHALLHAPDQFGILGIDLAVDPPVEVARRFHFPAVVRDRVADFADQRFGR